MDALAELLWWLVGQWQHLAGTTRRNCRFNVAGPWAPLLVVRIRGKGPGGPGLPPVWYKAGHSPTLLFGSADFQAVLLQKWRTPFICLAEQVSGTGKATTETPVQTLLNSEGSAHVQAA